MTPSYANGKWRSNLKDLMHHSIHSIHSLRLALFFHLFLIFIAEGLHVVVARATLRCLACACAQQKNAKAVEIHEQMVTLPLGLSKCRGFPSCSYWPALSSWNFLSKHKHPTRQTYDASWLHQNLTTMAHLRLATLQHLHPRHYTAHHPRSPLHPPLVPRRWGSLDSTRRLLRWT